MKIKYLEAFSRYLNDELNEIIPFDSPNEYDYIDYLLEQHNIVILEEE